MSMETKRPPDHDSPGAPNEGYERRDADVRSLAKFGLWMFVTLIVVLFAMKWMFSYFAKSQQLGPPASPFENVRVLPPNPRLQVEPVVELRKYRDAQQNALESYGWVDKQNGVVRIPVDRAMELLLERGLPARPVGGVTVIGGNTPSNPPADSRVRHGATSSAGGSEQ